MTGTEDSGLVKNLKEEPKVDEGYAWIILLGSALNYTMYFGYLNSFGVFQEFYLNTLFADKPASVISWISTLTFAFTLSGAVLAAPVISRIGIRNTAMLGACLCCLGLTMASFGTKSVAFLVFSQGIVCSLGQAISLNCSLVAPSLWFVKKRRLAFAVILSCGAFGTLPLVPVISVCLMKLGIEWTLRVLALVFLITTGIGGYLLKPRTTFASPKKILNFALLKDPFLALLSLSGTLTHGGYSVTALYYAASLRAIGASRLLSSNTVILFACFVGVGRLFSGYMSGKIGNINSLIVTTYISSITIFAIWLPATTVPVYIIFVAIFGFFSTFYFPLAPVIMAEHYTPDKISQANGLSYFVLGCGAMIWIPVTSFLFDSLGGREDFTPVIVACGVLYFCSASVQVVLRQYMLKKVLKSDQMKI